MKIRFDMMSAEGIIDAIHYLEGRNLDIGNSLISANYCSKIGYALSANRFDFYEEVEPNDYKVKCSFQADGPIHYMDVHEDVLVQFDDDYVVYGLYVELVHVDDGIEYALELIQVE